MVFFAHGDASHFLSTYSYWAVAALVAVDIPPGETTLIAAGLVAAASHAMSIWFVIAAAAAGAIVGDNFSFWIGRELGYRLVLRYGHHLKLTESRIKVGQYIFRRHGGKVVSIVRYVAVLRTVAVFFAGANRMTWPLFLFFDAAGAISWAAVYGIASYALGKSVSRLAEPIGFAIAVGAAAAIVVAIVVLRRHGRALEERAEAAIPGPLRPGGRQRQRRS